MDFQNNLTYRTDRYQLYNNLGDNKYNYARHGILKHCLPKIFFEGNSIFVTFLQLIDVRLIMLLKYVDKIKRFKWVTWYQ